MRLRCNILYHFLFSLLVCASHGALSAEKRWPQVRTLAQVPASTEQLWVLTSGDGFYLTDALRKSAPRYSGLSTLTLRSVGGRIAINTAWCHTDILTIRPRSGRFMFAGQWYKGSAQLVRTRNSMTLRTVGEGPVYTWPPQSVVATPPPVSKKISRRAKKRAQKKEAFIHTKQETEDQVAALEQAAQHASAPAEPLVEAAQSVVRVLLDMGAVQEAKKWIIHSQEGFMIMQHKENKKTIRHRAPEATVSIAGNVIRVGKRTFKSEQITLVPIDGHIQFGKRHYQGVFQLVNDGKGTFLINCIGIEDYLFSVMRSEGWPGWPLEVYKVLAITSRSYVIAMAREARLTGRPYHIKNTISHQVYKGFHGVTRLRDAVDQTRGIFMTYEQKPIVAMFDSCCGGVVPAHIKGPHYHKAPYLARSYACTHCKPTNVYKWQASYSVAELEDHLRATLRNFTSIKDIVVTKRDKAGTVQEVLVKGPNKTSWKVPGKRMYSLLKDVKSFTYSVKKKSDKLVFEGRGFGHHLGLCQWGAREMVRSGWDHQRILQFYYPGTSFMRLE